MSLVGLIHWHEFLRQRKVPSILCVTFWVFLLLDCSTVRWDPLPTDFCFLYCDCATPSTTIYEFLDGVKQAVSVLLACLVASVNPSFLLRHQHVKYLLWYVFSIRNVVEWLLLGHGLVETVFGRSNFCMLFYKPIILQGFFHPIILVGVADFVKPLVNVLLNDSIAPFNWGW